MSLWKVILLETHKVHLVQGNPFPGATRETDMLPSVPSSEGFVQFPLNLRLRWSQFGEDGVNSLQKLQRRSQPSCPGPPKQPHVRKKLICPQGPGLCWLLGTRSSSRQRGEARSGREPARSPTTCSLSQWPEESSILHQTCLIEKSNPMSRCPWVPWRFCSYRFDGQLFASLLTLWNMLNFKLLELLPKQVSRRRFPWTTAHRRCCDFELCLVRRDGCGTRLPATSLYHESNARCDLS